MTLRALAANDERIVEYFRSVSEGKKIPKRITPIEFVTPVGTEIDYKQFEDDLKLKVWGRLAKLSWRPFEGAREFTRSLNFKIIYQWREYAKSKSKPEDIPACPNQIYLAKGWISFPDWLGYKSKNYIHNKTPFYTANKYALKSGIKTQLQWQKAYDRGELPEGLPKNPHQAYIDEGFTTWFDFLGTESPDDFMNKGLNLLKEYAKKNKHCNPYEEKVYKGFNLWYFVLNVRKSYKQNLIFESTGTYDPKKGRPLTDEEVARLNQITYWSWKSKGEQEWINAFEEILNIQKTNGLNFLKIPTDLRLSSGMKAQRWISRQRTNKRTGRGNLNDERISLLETKLEGWSWDPQEDISINNYKDIAQYFEKEKPESITQKLVYKGKKIGTTVSKVRQNYKANKLSGELIEKYNLLKNWTWDASGAIPSNRLIGSYNQARKKAIHFGLKTSLEYRAFIKELNSTMDSFQKRLPFNPADYYKDKGWKGWDHFLGKTK